MSQCRALVPVDSTAPDQAAIATDAIEVIDSAPRAQAVVSLHPLGIDRRVEMAPLVPGETVADYLGRIGVPAGVPLTLRLSGRRLPRELWHRTRPRPGQLIEVQAVVHGNRQSGSQKILGALLVGLSFITGLPQLASYGIKLIIGGFLTAAVSALTSRKQLSNSRGQETSPSYSISGTQNRTRPYEPLPLVLGRHRLVPDFAAQPYTDFENNEQFFNAIYHFGLLGGGQVEVTELRLGNTLLNSYPDVRIEWSDSQGRIALVASDVDTLPGGQLEPGTPWGQWITRQSPPNTVALILDVEGLLYGQGQNGLVGRQVDIQAEVRALPTGQFEAFFSSSTQEATSYWSEGYLEGTSGQWEQVSFSSDLSPNAFVENALSGNSLWVPNGDGPLEQLPLRWSYRSVTEARSRGWTLPPLSLVATTVDFTRLSNATTRPVRRSFRRDLPAGQYEVRVRRSAQNVAQGDTDQFQLSGVRCVQLDDTDYRGQLRLGVRIRATAQASGTVDALNAIVERSVWADVAYNGSWLLQPTRNPAWLLLAVMVGIRRDADQRLVFGLGLPAERIDYDSLRAWAQWCAAKGYECSLVLDRELSNRELVETICTAGFASPQWLGDKLGVVFDREGLPVSAVVAMPNILGGTFRVDYNTAAAPDEVVVTYLNADNSWQQEEVRVTLPGVVSPRKVERIELLGVNKQAHAAAFANLRAAAYIYRRKTVSWAMDVEGTLIRRGDVVAFSHDLTQWGFSGRVVSLSGGGTGAELVLDRRVPANLQAANDEWVGIRVPGEQGLRVLRVQCVPQGADNDNDRLTLVDPWPAGVPLPGAVRPALDYVWLFDFRSTPGARFKVIETVPQQRGDGSIAVQFTAVPEVPEFYAAAGGTFTPVVPPTLLSNQAEISSFLLTVAKVVVDGLQVYEATIAWSPNLATNLVRLQGQTGSRQTVGGNIVEQFDTSVPAGTRSYSFRVRPGETWSVIGTPFNGVGQSGTPRVSNEITVDAVPPELPDSFGVSVAANGTRIYTWAYTSTPRPADLKGVRIRFGLGSNLTWEQMQPLESDGGFFTVSPAQSLFPGASGTYSFGLKSEDQSGNLSTGTRTAQLTITIGGLTEDTNPYGFKSLFQNRYTGASTVTVADNGKAHVKEDATPVSLPNTLPAEILTTVINDNDTTWLRVNFPDAVAVVQGRSDTVGAAAWELAPRNSLSVTKLKSGVWLVSGRVRSV